MKEEFEQASAAAASQWHNLPWKKIQVGGSNASAAATTTEGGEESDTIDNDTFLNNKNHYDDPNADPNDLYGGITNRYQYDAESKIEGADDPGIFVGLEVIDGSQYQVEKIKFGKGSHAGHITRLIIDRDNTTSVGGGTFQSSDTNLNRQSKKKKKTESKKTEGHKDQTDKLSSSDSMKDVEEQQEESKKLTRKQRNRLKFKKIIAERKERRAEKKRKRDHEESSLSTTTRGDEQVIVSSSSNDNNDVPSSKSNSNDNSIEKRKQSNKSVEDDHVVVDDDIEIDSAIKEQITSLQNAWAMNTGGVLLHEKICMSLHHMEFNSPTPIQASTLAASILGQRDIVGAAPTGSGKTLSYLIPILHYLLNKADERINNSQQNKSEEKKEKSKLISLILCPTRELAMQVSNEYSKLVSSCESEPFYNKIKCGSIVGGLSEQKQKRVLDVKRPPVLVGTPGRLWDLMSSGDHEHLSDLSQLRFLVVDEADRMINQGSFPQLKHILEKIRLSNPSPDDSDSDDDTDSEEDDRLQSLPGILGEAKVQMLNDEILKMIDQQKMTEKPLEVDEVEGDISINDDCDLSAISAPEEKDVVVKRQTFIYSATLTLPGSSKDQQISTKLKNGNKEVVMNGAIAEILEKVGAQGQSKVVDLSVEIKKGIKKAVTSKNDRAEHTKREFKLPPGLSLYEVACTQKHKDSHLYAFLATTKQGSSGPCLIFCNSIGAVKRVGETLKTLGLPIRMLHAQMPQKARMTAVESLSKAGSRSVVVATDVAARGLDIPSVATVVHYDVPRATDLFVHRAGRTARGMGKNAVGWSVSLISAPEEKRHQQICEQILGTGTKHFDNAPMDSRLLSAAQERVNLASKIVTTSAAESKAQKNNKWFIDAANEAGFDLDEGMLEDGLAGGNRKEQHSVIEAKRARQQLKMLLAQPMRIQSFGKFLSGAGLSQSMKAEMEVKPYLVTSEKKNVSRKKKKVRL